MVVGQCIVNSWRACAHVFFLANDVQKMGKNLIVGVNPINDNEWRSGRK